ncbi:hypothetical protein Micbo1qcDRAFT_176425 [Microdochium bolleyi]|uniref:Protein SQS1 n=1 Tax=Microdochium bolleyi TaxID=196109 RepID=A0A136J0T1_9PEZI|nr:hypothetical protein Micbo1qcDRAFT_176425 [Microdochium bolleyi]
MAEEVRNTLFHRRELMGRGNSRLRHQPVVFVSAGLMDPLEDFEVKPNQSSQPPASPAPPVVSQAQGEMAAVLPARSPSPSSPAVASIPCVPAEENSSDPPEEPLFFIDTMGDRALRPSERVPEDEMNHSDLGSDSDASEDIILFKGRDHARHAPAQSEAAHTQKAANQEIESLNLPELTIELEHISVETAQRTVVEPAALSSKPTASRVVNPPVSHPDSDDFVSLTSSRKKSRGKQSRSRRPRDDLSDEEAAIVADYIANMRDEADSDEDTGDVHPGLGSHAFHMLRDIGGTDSDAVPARIISEDDSSRTSDDDENDEPNEEALQRRAEAQDAKLARLLAKQEELGMGGDDIVLFDDADTDGNDGDGWQIAPKQTPRRRKKKGASKQARIVQEKGQYPSASRMAEVFDDLDLMDWQRPSLNNFKPIGKRQQPVFDVSDSDLEEAMAIAWKKDRAKKAEKKKAREELRSQGLLGKNVNPDDLRVKYRGGMSIDDMEVEFETFLMGTHEQIHLPPFDKKGRQTVHLIANKFKIKSQSAGKGNTRCPVLYRTKATLPYEADFFNNVFSRIKQSWFPRVDVDDQVVSEAKVFRARSELGASRAKKRGVVHLREGEVVGQHASELGIENKGRAMLEKMGWSKGMALGTEDNRGIIVPITHVVKKGKAGLGDI